MNAVQISLSLWLFWYVYWIISARHRIRSTEQSQAKREAVVGRVGYMGLMIFGFVLLFLPLGQPWLIKRLWPANELWLIAGLVIEIAGMLFAVWARHTLGKNWTGRITTGGSQELIMQGPYRLVRHPIYTGLLCAVLGTAMIIGDLHSAVGFAVLLISILIKLRREEAALRQHFGTAYEGYAQRVPMLLPGL